MCTDEVESSDKSINTLGLPDTTPVARILPEGPTPNHKMKIGDIEVSMANASCNMDTNMRMLEIRAQNLLKFRYELTAHGHTQTQEHYETETASTSTTAEPTYTVDDVMRMVRPEQYNTRAGNTAPSELRQNCDKCMSVRQAVSVKNMCLVVFSWTIPLKTLCVFLTTLSLTEFAVHCI